MLAAVIRAIDAGDLTENCIDFDRMLPRFLGQLTEWNAAGGVEQAAYAFFHLSRETFWLLSYRQPREAATLAGRVSPKAIRESVSHARLKDSFWPALQRSDLRERVMLSLERRWIGGRERMKTINLNEAVLAEAVDKTIRPWLIDRGEAIRQGRRGLPPPGRAASGEPSSPTGKHRIDSA